MNEWSHQSPFREAESCFDCRWISLSVGGHLVLSSSLFFSPLSLSCSLANFTALSSILSTCFSNHTTEEETGLPRKPHGKNGMSEYVSVWLLFLYIYPHMTESFRSKGQAIVTYLISLAVLSPKTIELCLHLPDKDVSWLQELWPQSLRSKSGGCVMLLQRCHITT